MITCPRVLNVCPKTILLPRWPRDAKRLDAPGPEVPGVCIHWSVCVHVCEIPEDSVVCTCVLLGDHQPPDPDEASWEISGGPRGRHDSHLSLQRSLTSAGRGEGRPGAQDPGELTGGGRHRDPGLEPGVGPAKHLPSLSLGLGFLHAPGSPQDQRRLCPWGGLGWTGGPWDRRKVGA